jgi:rod shape-determining protein MreD
MICFILIFSFLLEASFTNFISTDSVFIPLFVITSLVLLYPYFENKNLNYIIVCLILGIFYDIAFTNSPFINTISFGLIGGLIILCYNYVKYNVYTSNIINIIILISYRIISYIMILSINYVSFNNKIFFAGIYKSIILNVIYGVLFYFIIDLLAKIFNKKRVE